MKKRIALSLFHGMGCFNIALEKCSVKFEKVYVSEVDKFAIKEDKENNPENIHLGDVTKWREWDVDWSSIDLLIGGSPCQGFSFAGKQLAFDDPRSALFFVYVDILNHIKSVNPDVKFMLENVRMKKEHLNVITEYLGVDPVFINSALVSAQNRQRYYWCNWEVTQPEDRGILLADIVESGEADRDKSFCIDANYFKGGSLKNYLEKKRRQIVFNESVSFSQSGNRLMVSEDERLKDETFEQWYAKTKDWGGTREEWDALQMQVNSAAVVGRKINPETGKREDYNPNLPTLQTLEVQNHGKARCLSTVSKDCLVSNLPPGRYQENLSYRKLTVVECCRLQGVPDNYFKVSSNTQSYKMLGNGWQCDTIEHIFNCLFEG
tara:strand:+ start:23383 stop:24516 length:1134 start_codon:yes stop_codon:yes gene_type:complete